MKSLVFLVTAGPTREFLDPTRFISNPSTGKMGYAIAQAANDIGGKVILISGPTQIAPPSCHKFIRVTSAVQMYERVMEFLDDANIVIMAAAVADYQPVEYHHQKLKKSSDKISLKLKKTPDILEKIGERKGEKYLVGFAAETENLIENAKKKLISKNLDLIVANDVYSADTGFGSDMNKVWLINRNFSVFELPKCTKTELAKIIIERVVTNFGKKSDS